MSWQRVLDDYEALVARLERAVERGDWEDLEPAFSEPEAPPEAPTDAERERFEALQRRAEVVAEAIHDAMGGIGEELSHGDKRRTAARTYLSTGGEAPPSEL